MEEAEAAVGAVGGFAVTMEVWSSLASEDEEGEDDEEEDEEDEFQFQKACFNHGEEVQGDSRHLNANCNNNNANDLLCREVTQGEMEERERVRGVGKLRENSLLTRAR